MCIKWENAPRFPKAVEMKMKASPRNDIWRWKQGDPPGPGTEMDI